VIADGIVDPLPVKPLAHVLLSVADEAALYVAAAADKEEARRNMVTITRRIVRSLMS
jgi:hypothetical protein